MSRDKTVVVQPSCLRRLGPFCFFAALLVLASVPVLAGKKPRPIILAPTGFRGILHPKWPHTPVEIEVAVIEEGSPSDGTELKVGDVIVGIGDEKFKEHPIPAMAKAVDIGEAAGGNLKLLLKTGKQVTIKLANLGAYSATAPYNCPKSNKIIEQAAAQLLKEEGLGSQPTRTGLLGLMATGEKEHLDAVTKIIQASGMIKVDPKAVDDCIKGKKAMGSTGWTWGYTLIALGEYYLLTKDENVLPAIRTYAVGLARGQDAVGLWGHRMSRDGRAPGYGIMNQPSLSSFMGMLFARKCGIEDPVLDKGIARTYAYVADHIDKGGFPYGVHGPSSNQLNNNGTSGSAAICMALMRNKHGTSFFSKMCGPTYGQLQVGHASKFFNPLWTPLGVNRSGPELTQRFFKRTLWYFNSKRHWKGGFPGKGRGGYFAGQALLTYCLPRKVLLITGREADESIWVKAPEAEDLIAKGQLDYGKLSDDELFALLNHQLPPVRGKAAARLAGKVNKIHQFKSKPQPNSIVPRLLEMIKSGKEGDRVIALKSLAGCTWVVLEPQATMVAGIMNNKEEPLAVRVAAASALGGGNFREAALPYYNDILKLVLEERTKPDPFGHVDNKLSRAIGGNIFKSVRNKEVLNDFTPDKDLVYRVAAKLLGHKRQQVRGTGVRMLKGISLEEFHIVADKLMVVLNGKDRTYHTYSSVLNPDGIGILADLNIKEGLDLLEHGIFKGGGKWGFKYRALIKALPKYGANAAPYIEKFEAHKDINKKGDRFTPAWQNAVKQICEDKEPKKLMTVQEAIQVGKQKQEE